MVESCGVKQQTLVLLYTCSAGAEMALLARENLRTTRTRISYARLGTVSHQTRRGWGMAAWHEIDLIRFAIYPTNLPIP
jgi:hypothetical protein